MIDKLKMNDQILKIHNGHNSSWIDEMIMQNRMLREVVD